MSRFFASLESSGSESENEAFETKKNKFMNSDYSESESGSEFSDFSDSESSETSENEGEFEEEQAAPIRKSRFLMDSDSDEDEDASGRVLKSQKEKSFEEINSYISLITDSTKNGDWNGANINFDRLVKITVKSQRLGLPAEFFIFLNELDTQFITKISVSEIKKLDKDTAKAFNALRQKSRKAISAYSDEIKRATSTEEELAQANEAFKLPKFGKIENLINGEATKSIELTSENVTRKLQEIVSSRGRKNVDRHENLSILHKLFDLATCSEQKIQILNSQISTEFDIASLGTGPNMSHSLWSSALQNIICLLELLLSNSKFSSGTEESDAHSPADNDEVDGFAGLPTVAGIRGSFSSYLYRIDDEYMRALQSIDAHSGEYLEFLRDETTLTALLIRSRLFFTSIKNLETESQILVRYLEHIYYKTVVSLHKSGLDFSPKSVVEAVSSCFNDKLKHKAQLCLIYHLALNDDYTAARELFISLRFQEIAPTLDVNCQIIYNRAVVQLALCSFRLGFIKDTYFSLQEICSSGRPKELLAQGVQFQKFSEKTPEQERAERQLQLPSHMHLNVELIDCIFLTCSMILEVPQATLFSKKSHNNERKMYQSRHLKRLIDAVERNVFTGPAENTREALVMAAQSLALSDWETSARLCFAIKVWETIPNFENSICPMILDHIKKSALCTFIYSFGSSFESLSIAYLAETFEIEVNTVTDLVIRLIQESGIVASLDCDQKFVLWKTGVELSKVQEMTMSLSDKIQVIIDRNDEISESLHRSISFKL